MLVGHQPEGLTDSSRWLKRSEDHRNKSEKSCTPEGGENLKENLLQSLLIWHPLPGQSFLRLNPAGFAPLPSLATFPQPYGLHSSTSKLNPRMTNGDSLFIP